MRVSKAVDEALEGKPEESHGCWLNEKNSESWGIRRSTPVVYGKSRCDVAPGSVDEIISAPLSAPQLALDAALLLVKERVLLCDWPKTVRYSVIGWLLSARSKCDMMSHVLAQMRLVFVYYCIFIFFDARLYLKDLIIIFLSWFN